MKLSFNKLIGRGSAGEVWEATDELGREVAVKFFTVGTPENVEQDVKAHALGLHRVNHPAVARLYAVEHQPDPDAPGNERLAIIMERVPGVPLHLHKDDLALGAARLAVEQLAAGLSAIHAAGMVHGDLHDGNVMISPSGAKLIDILYTHSLREVGSRIARENRRGDVREFATLVQTILEKTPEGRAAKRALSDARYQAESAETPADVVLAFAVMLGVPDASEGPAQRLAVGPSDGDGPIPEVIRLSPDTLAHEVGVFLKGDEILSEVRLLPILEVISADHSYRERECRALLEFVGHFELESNAYITRELQMVCRSAVNAIDELTVFLATHFFVFPERQTPSPDGTRYCMYPELNIDRRGTTPAHAARYAEFAKDLQAVIHRVDDAFVEYRRTIKRTLLR